MLRTPSLRQKLGLTLLPLIILLCSLACYILYLSFEQATVTQTFTWFYIKLSSFIVITIVLFVWLRWVSLNIMRENDTLQAQLQDYQRLTRELKQVFGALSNGDLTQTVNDNYSDQLHELKEDVNNTVLHLRQSIFDVKQVIDTAAQGVFDRRVSLENKQGLFKELAENLNQNLSLNQQVVEEVMRVFAAVAVGDLTQTMTQNYFGMLAQLKTDVNTSVRKLNEVMDEISSVVESAARGVFDKRINLLGKEGFFKHISNNLNKNLDVNQQVFEEVMRVFAAVSSGNLTQTISQSYSGSLLQLKTDVNDSVRKLNEVMNEISTVVDSAAQGVFDKRVNLAGKEGFFRTISENLNQNLDINQGIIEELMTVFSAMSQGNLQKCLVNEYVGRLSELKYDVNATINKLNEMMTNIFQLTEEVDNGANEIAQGNLSLSQRTEEQAAALEETASSMQQMTDTVRQTAENAQQANQLSILAKVSAERGGQVVYQAVQAMTEITKSSNQMSDIISVIDEIAFQTNLLALNAAVEAARAGEQGRGFAVVAIEVRNLAQRSATAAKEIKLLIKDSLSKVEEGSQLVNQSGKALDEIMLNAKKVSDIIAEIAAAGQEQASGIVQVNRAVTQLDETTQQNAAMVEEITASSDSTKGQVKQLRTLLSFFQFEGRNQVTTAMDLAKRHAPALPPTAPAHVSKNSHPTTYRTTSHAKSIATEVHKKLPSKRHRPDDEWDEF